MKQKAEQKPLILGVVILHFGEQTDTYDCLRSLDKAIKKQFLIRIFLIDNDRKHRLSEEKLKTFNFKISYRKNKTNKGFAGGVNQGVRAALKERCDYILLLNNDVVVSKHLFQKLFPYLQKKSIDILSPVITYYDDADKLWCCDGYLNEAFLFTTYPHMNASLKETFLPDVHYSDFGAAVLFVKSTVFMNIGFLEEKYFLNVEDVEWCYRARKAGYRLAYIGLPLARHKVSVNTGIRGTNLLGPMNAYFYGRNFFIFLRDHRQTLPVFSGILGQLFIRFPFYIIFRMSSLSAAVAYIQGMIDGWVYFRTNRLPKARILPR